MSSFLRFLGKFAQHLGVRFEVGEINGQDEYELAANILNEINKFLYQKKATLPSEYISDLPEICKPQFQFPFFYLSFSFSPLSLHQLGYSPSPVLLHPKLAYQKLGH